MDTYFRNTAYLIKDKVGGRKTGKKNTWGHAYRQIHVDSRSTEIKPILKKLTFCC